MRDDISDEVEKATYEAGMDFLINHQFMVETKNGKDAIVWTSSIYNRNYADLYLQDRASGFLRFAEKAGLSYLRQNDCSHLPHKKDLLNHGIGRAIATYIHLQKNNLMEIEMQVMKI